MIDIEGAIFTPGLIPDEHGLVGLGGRLSPRTVVEAYRHGIFPWTGRHPIPWFSPDPRLILRPGDLRVTRSLKKTARRGELEVTLDAAFSDVMRACATTCRPGQDGTWITPHMTAAWCQLHDLGLAHSVETWVDGALVGGLYGLALGRAFFGESMFHHVTDASKLALWALARTLEQRGFHLIDCQQVTDHMLSMGAVPLPRTEFLRRLAAALAHRIEPGPWRDAVPELG